MNAPMSCMRGQGQTWPRLKAAMTKILRHRGQLCDRPSPSCRPRLQPPCHRAGAFACEIGGRHGRRRPRTARASLVKPVTAGHAANASTAYGTKGSPPPTGEGW
jgi:hypothetical protein